MTILNGPRILDNNEVATAEKKDSSTALAEQQP